MTIPWGTEDGLNIWRTVQHKPKVDMDTLMSGIQRVSSHGLVLRFLLCPYCAFVHGESTGFIDTHMMVSSVLDRVMESHVLIS